MTVEAKSVLSYELNESPSKLELFRESDLAMKSDDIAWKVRVNHEKSTKKMKKHHVPSFSIGFPIVISHLLMIS